MITKPRLLSAGYWFAMAAVVVVIEAAVQVMVGVRVVGGLAAAGFATGLRLVWQDPAEAAAEARAAAADRRAGELEKQVAGFKSPNRPARDAA